MRHRRADRQMDRSPGLILYDSYRKDGASIMFFGNSRIKFSSIIWLDCEPYGNNQYKKKEHNQHSSVFKEFKSNNSLAKLRKLTFILFKFHISIDKSIDFYFFLFRERVHNNKEFSHGNSKPCLESQIRTC